MVRVLVIGYAPDAVDFTDPAIPPGADAAKVEAGLQRDLQLMRERGWQPVHLSIRPDEDLEQHISTHLQDNYYDCIVIGAGVRVTTKHVPEFEKVINAVKQSAPKTPIAFNSGPDTSGDAAARWLRPQDR